MVISIMFVILGIVALVQSARRPVPGDRPAGDPDLYDHYTGADAETVEQSVATPIEQQISGVDNMNYMYSVNANNGTMRMFGQLRCQDRPEYGPDPHPDAAESGPAAASR